MATIWIVLKSLLISGLSALLVRSLLPSIRIWRKVNAWNRSVRRAERDPDYWKAINWLNWIFQGIGAGLRGVAKLRWQFRDAFRKAYPGRWPAWFRPIPFSALIAGSSLAPTPFDRMHLQWFSPATYYCDPAGNDATGDGSVGNPWKLLSHACLHATNVGDIIHINAGTYTDTGGHVDLALGVSIEGAGKGLVTINTDTGAPAYGSYILCLSAVDTDGDNTISAFTLDGGNTASLWGIRSRGRSAVVVHDVAFNHFRGRTAMRIEGDPNTTSSAEPSYYAHDVLVYNCDFHDACYGNGGGTHYGALEIESLAGALIHDNTFDLSMAGTGCALKHAQYGWYKGCEIYNNTVDTLQTDGNAFVLECYNFCDDSLIYENTFNGPFSLNGGLRTVIGGSIWNLQITDNTFDMSASETADAFLELSHNYLLFDSNYIEGNPDHCRGAGVWGTNYLTGTAAGGPFHIQISRNVVYNTAETALYIDAGNSDVSYVDFWNNVIDTVNTVAWGGRGFTVINGNDVTNWTFKNNIILNCDTWCWAIDDVACVGGFLDHTFVYGCGNSNNGYDNGIGNTVANNTKADPALYKSGAKPDPYYRPSSDAANVVDAGVDVGLTYIGIAPDIGRYEWGVTNPYVRFY